MTRTILCSMLSLLMLFVITRTLPAAESGARDIDAAVQSVINDRELVEETASRRTATNAGTLNPNAIDNLGPLGNASADRYPSPRATIPPVPADTTAEAQTNSGSSWWLWAVIAVAAIVYFMSRSSKRKTYPTNPT